VATSYDIKRQLLVSEVQHMAEINVSRFIDNLTTVSTNANATNSTNFQGYDVHKANPTIIVINYAAAVLGIPVNILSAIIWLRLHATSKNSSAIYLAALAIVDLVYLPLRVITVKSLCGTGWFNIWCCWYLHASAQILDPLLVLGFSAERLIAILRPLQV